MITDFTKQQEFRPVHFESICRQQYKSNLKTEILFWMGRKHCGKRRNCWLPAFSRFPMMFFKVSSFGVITNRDSELNLRV